MDLSLALIFLAKTRFVWRSKEELTILNFIGRQCWRRHIFHSQICHAVELSCYPLGKHLFGSDPEPRCNMVVGPRLLSSSVARLMR